jgi:hypothetical protein
MFRALGIEATRLRPSKNVSAFFLDAGSGLFDPGSDRVFTSDFQSHFKEIARQHSPEQRRYYVHLTSVIVCIHYDVMDLIPLRTISHRTRVARRLR